MKEITTIRTLAPEDVRPGLYVAVYTETCEVIPFGFDPSTCQKPLVRVETLPDVVEPLRVVDVCVPFVLVKNHREKHRTLDLRQARLVRLPDAFGKRAMKKLGAKGD